MSSMQYATMVPPRINVSVALVLEKIRMVTALVSSYKSSLLRISR